MLEEQKRIKRKRRKRKKEKKEKKKKKKKKRETVPKGKYNSLLLEGQFLEESYFPM